MQISYPPSSSPLKQRVLCVSDPRPHQAPEPDQHADPDPSTFPAKQKPWSHSFQVLGSPQAPCAEYTHLKNPSNAPHIPHTHTSHPESHSPLPSLLPLRRTRMIRTSPLRIPDNGSVTVDPRSF